MADNCTPQVGGIILDSACNFQEPGGIKKEVYVGSISELEGYTTDATTKAIKTIDLKAGAKLGKLIGRKLKNNTSTGLETSEYSRLFPHTLLFIAFLKTQLEKEGLENLAKVEDLFAIVHNNDGTFEAFGLAGSNGTLGNGLSMTALEHNSGTALTDGRPYSLTFSGAESKLPMNVELGVSQAATLAALEAMHTTVAPAPEV